VDILTYGALKRYVDKAVELGTGLSPSDVVNLQAIVNQLKSEVDAAKTRVADLSAAVDGKVDAIDGKGLSTNDFTDELRDKLTQLSESADTGDIDIVRVNDVDLPISGGAVNIPLAGQGVYGVVTSSDEENKITILPDGTMQLNSISLSNITTDSETSVIFVGGDSSAN